MATKVFISYRRDDARYPARMIHAAFCKAMPSDHVFIDVDSIPPGADFRMILKDRVGQCGVLLALIGPGWIDARDPKTKRRRLHSKSDFVCTEIGEALARNIAVVPVLIDDAPMPDIKLLPGDLKELVGRQAVSVEWRTFDADVKRLIRKLRLSQDVGPMSEAQKLRGRRPRKLAALSVIDRYRSEGRIKVEAKVVSGASEGWFLPGNGKVEWFKDHEMGSEMVVVPAGEFMMGSLETVRERLEERPQHRVTIARPFAVGRHAVSHGQFAAFVKSTGYKQKTLFWALLLAGEAQKNRAMLGWMTQDDSHPAEYVSWDARAFTTWLSDQSGQDYRLLSEAQWEYTARAGTTTSFW